MELMREGKELLENIFEIPTAAIMEITDFWRKRSCITVKIYRHGRGTAATCTFTLKKEEVGASETSAKCLLDYTASHPKRYACFRSYSNISLTL
jgi:hypothetical protein